MDLRLPPGFAEALLSTEHASREAHGGEGRIKPARFPARKTLEEFDFRFQRSVKTTLIQHPRPARLPARSRERRAARPARHR
jgi:DNA replication protein DnaC